MTLDAAETMEMSPSPAMLISPVSSISRVATEVAPSYVSSCSNLEFTLNVPVRVNLHFFILWIIYNGESGTETQK